MTGTTPRSDAARRRTRRAAAVATLALSAGAVPVALATPASADPTVVTVTTPNDGRNPADGQTTLREAVDIANAAAGPTEIVLLPFTDHVLSVCGTGEDDTNVAGDLDITSAFDVTISGGGAAGIEQSCAGHRHLDVDPSGGTATLHIFGTALHNATDVTGQGISIRTTGPLDLDVVTIRDNSASTTSAVPQAAIYATQSTSIELTTSNVVRTARGAGIAADTTGAGTAVHLVASGVSDNWTDGNADAAGIAVGLDSEVTLTNSVVFGNRSAAAAIPADPITSLDELLALDVTSPVGGIDGGDVTLTDSLVAYNGGSAVGGVAGWNVVVTGSDITGNRTSGDGPGAGAISSEQVTVTDSTISGNGSGATVGGIVASDDIEIVGSVLADNVGATAGAIDSSLSLSTVHTTISGNRAPLAAAIAARSGQANLEATTVADNLGLDTAPVDPQRSSILVGDAAAPTDAELILASTFVGAASAGTPACVLATAGSNVASEWYNADSDDTCDLVHPTDLPGIGDPELVPLADNGGPTQTRLPSAWSALKDHIPSGAYLCSPGDVSQNGLSLPQGPGCEIGAAERPAATALYGTVTETGTGVPLAGIQVRVRTSANTYVAATTTGADGRWYVGGLAPGDYKVLFRDATKNHQQIFNGSAAMFGAAAPITVAAGDELITDQAMMFTPAISGTVTETGTGTPLGGIQVRARTLANTFVGATTTAADGTYALHLPPGTYKLVFTDPTGTHIAEWYADKPGFAKATAVTHVDATTTANAQLTPITG